MNDVTHLFHSYRECVRHLWNTHFQPLAAHQNLTGYNWDVRHEFNDISVNIFSSLVLRELDVFNIEMSAEYLPNPVELPGFTIVPSSQNGAIIHINRNVPRSGYWDYPISIVKPADVELNLLRHFDFDVLGYRDFKYFEVVIHSSPKYPEIVGRVALIEVGNSLVFHKKTLANA